MSRKRSDLKEDSIKTYTYCLNYILYDLLKIKKLFTLELFNQQDDIIKLLKATSKTPTQRKVYWWALSIVTDNNDKYKNEHQQDVILDEQNRNEQTKTDKQNDNWVTQQELKDKYKELKDTFDEISSKDDITAKEYQKLQEFLIIGLYSKLEGTPRLKELVEMKINNYCLTDNYYDGKYFYYNIYKTVETDKMNKLAYSFYDVIPSLNSCIR